MNNPTRHCIPARLHRLSRLILLGLFSLAAAGPGLAAETASTSAKPSAPTSASLTHLNRDSFDQIKIADETQLQFAVFGDAAGGGPLFEKLLREISQDPATQFAVHLGDLVTSGTQREYAAVLDQVKKNLKIPLLVIPGRGDLENGTDNTRYKSIFGDPYYAFAIGRPGFAFYMLDTSTPSALDDRQLEWLEKKMARGAALYNQVLFTHVPLFDPRVGGDKGLPPDKAEKLMDLLRKYRVSRVFAGNIHGLYSGNWEGSRYVISGGAGAPLDKADASHAFHHYLVVKLVSTTADVTAHKVSLEPPATRPDGQEESQVLSIP